MNQLYFIQYIPVSAAKPTSVIRRLSRLTDFSEFNADIFFMPVSVTNVNERLMPCKFWKPAKMEYLSN
jgi:hypothetical protein